ncbi:MAG: protein kinase domain-containing protein [Micromonosporaceae bacterium]
MSDETPWAGGKQRDGDTGDAGEPWDAGEFAPGSQIAGYRLEEQIGIGGMAVVFRARDARLDRPVALKILAPGLASDQAFRQRFMRESRAAAAVDHPNIVPIFEAGEARGVLFIAMRYVQGRAYPPARRPWMRSRSALVVACAAVVGVAGAAFAIRAAGHTAALTVPGCSTAAVTAKSLTRVNRAAVAVPGKPFAVQVTRDSQWSFVTLGHSVGVLRNGGPLVPAFVRTIPVSAHAGAILTHSGRYLLVASGSGAAVISTAGAEQGNPDPVVGTLTSTAGGGAVEVAVSPDDRFAFVTLQDKNNLAVFNLKRALTSGFGPSDFVGSIRLGIRPTGMQVSSDHRWLYVTSQMRDPGSRQGVLSVLDLRRAETRPAAALVSTAGAGCSPVRVINSEDATVVWVTARESDALLAFSAAKLRSDPKHALLARVKVGEAPIGLTFVNHGTRILVANSNAFKVRGVTSSLAVIDTEAAMAGKPAVLGLIKTGLVPRQFTVQRNGKALLVTNSDSRQLQAVAIADLP